MLHKLKSHSEYQKILNRYPKKRIELNDEYKKIYKRHYMLNRSGEGVTNMISQKMESWMHRKVSKISAMNILEIGAGNLNHIKYESNYNNYDIVEPFTELYINSPLKKHIRNIFKSLDQVDEKYDKILSIATFEHLLNLPKEIDLCKRLLSKNGVLQIAVPCEGEIAFKLGWMLSTGIAFKLKHNLDYSKLIQYEHVNSLKEISILLNNNFIVSKFDRSPLILPIKNFSFYAYFECKLS
tara:strand:+ start:617 stop:1333 length:717 start_codon:yes stop_codon:yes gene_type:complete